ncbi:hypothetical protein VTH06DRAFT_2252 [Thermothelomyces fergusii]
MVFRLTLRGPGPEDRSWRSGAAWSVERALARPQTLNMYTQEPVEPCHSVQDPVIPFSYQSTAQLVDGRMTSDTVLLPPAAHKKKKTKPRV